MFNLLLFLLGAVLILVTIMITIVFVIAGGLRRSLAQIKIPAISGLIGILLIALGLLPSTVAIAVGIIFLVGGVLFFVWSSRHQRRKLLDQLLGLRGYLSRRHLKPVVRFLGHIGMLMVGVLTIDMIGLAIFLYIQGSGALLAFGRLLPLLLLLEGALVGAAGGFMFLGYSEHRISEQGALNPAIAADQRARWKERRLSQQKWGSRLLVMGALLILLGLLLDLLIYTFA